MSTLARIREFALPAIDGAYAHVHDCRHRRHASNYEPPFNKSPDADIAVQRALLKYSSRLGCEIPVLVRRSYNGSANSEAYLVAYCSATHGILYQGDVGFKGRVM